MRDPEMQKLYDETDRELDKASGREWPWIAIPVMGVVIVLALSVIAMALKLGDGLSGLAG